MTAFKTGQKWISNAEPELGMGRVIRQDERTVSLYFDAAAEERMYASAQAPLTRARFNPGDRVATQDGITITVTSVADQQGILVYHGDYQGTNTAVVETELDANVRFSKPEDRLFTRQIDENRWFNLRYESLNHRARLAASSSRGLYGPRVARIPHQLYIASEVASRFAPRVLLADEVGLGKTIEAGLIAHQQLQTGRASRILVIVPPALTFQWFVEMIRRFNLQFTVLDEARCQDIVADNMPEAGDNPERELEALLTGDEDPAPDAFNPFEAQQLMLCSLDLFIDNPERLEQAIDTDWDLVIVDEAHHLQWTPERRSTEYTVVELISRASKGLLLLTATPEQLGHAGHFARLRLLDPDRFHDYDAFREEEAQFEQVVKAATDLITGDDDDRDAARSSIRAQVGADDDAGDDDLLTALLDRHGTGRVLFRNVRSSVEGFPRRVPHPVPLDGDDDARLEWLIDLLEDRPADKFLLICSTQARAMQLEKQIAARTAVRAASFHEGMDLVERDRAAAWFADTEKGAQLLICSEIGSEGRNFQFASNLILFDLPRSPDVLEQRIGRLDRIGQRSDVQIHIPYLRGTVDERLYRWYAEGLNAFDKPNPVAQSLADELQPDFESGDLDAIIEETRTRNETRLAEVNRGRDRLLEMNSHRPEVSAHIVADLEANEGGEALEAYMEQSFETFGLESEPLGDAVMAVKPTEGMSRNVSVSLETAERFHYPELPDEGVRYTYDRTTALAREDVGFFTWENPIVEQALDVATSGTTGNSAMVAIRHPDLPGGTVLVETLHVIDLVAPAELGADRFLPPAVIRGVMTPKLVDIADRLDYDNFEDKALDVDVDALHKLVDSSRDGLRQMIARAGATAGAALDARRADATRRASRSFDAEIDRLEALLRVNNTIRPEEIEHLRLARKATLAAIEQAGVRLDAIRVVVAA